MRKSDSASKAITFRREKVATDPGERAKDIDRVEAFTNQKASLYACFECAAVMEMC